MIPFKSEVVVAGMSGRFPECDDVNSFKQKLYNSDNFITVNDKKWPVNYKYKFGEQIIPNATGKYVNVNTIDYQVFKMGRVQAYSSDALNRKMLEPSFEAVMDAGMNPYSLDGRNIGVYFASGINEMDTKLLKNNSCFLTLAGVAKTMISNHVSFALNLKGPSITFQTDPHGSLDAFIHGYKAVAEGLVEAALVGVASQVADPKFSLNLMELNLLSPDGLCRAYDKKANGFGRSESSVVFFLQRREDAKRNYGAIRLSDSLYDGRPENNPSSILNFKEKLLETFLRTIYAQYNFTDDVSSLSFVELSANGIKRSEAVESNAIANVCASYRTKPLLVGSIKSNVGHTEASAAFMSLFKALLALDTGVIAANSHLQDVNYGIKALKESKLQVVEKRTKLEGNLVGVNAVGLFGSLGHTVLQQNPKESKNAKSDNDNLPRLLLICGRTENGLKQKIKEIEALPFSKDFVSLANDVFSMYMPMHLYRGYTILPSPHPSANAVQDRGEKNRPLWYVFTGIGSQWSGMGNGLLDIPIFAEVIKRCDTILKHKGVDIYKILTSNDPSTFDNILNACVGITSVQLGLMAILETLELKPDGVIGHSAGETMCAYADGCITFEQAILISYERGRVLVENKTNKGMMAAIGLGYTQIREKLPKDIDVACHNSASNCTISGPVEKVVRVVEELQKNGVFARMVNAANIAFHSQQIRCLGPPFLAAMEKLIPDPKTRSSKWISSSVPEEDWHTPTGSYCSAKYMTNNLMNSVLFEEGCRHIPSDAIVVEISPHGLLQAVLKKSLPSTCMNIPLTNRTKTNPNFLLEAIGRLYIAGCEPQVNALYPKISYPVPRNTPSIASLATWEYSYITEDVSLLTLEKDLGLSHESICIRINEDAKFNFLKYHKVNGEVVIPSSLFMYLTWWMYSLSNNKKLESTSITFEEVKIHENVKISSLEPKSVSIMIQAGSGNFEVLLENDDDWNEITLIMSGRIVPIETRKIKANQKSRMKIIRTVEYEEIYANFTKAKYELGDDFSLLRRVSLNEAELFGEIVWRGNWITFLDSLMKFESFPHLNKTSAPLYPSFIRKLTIDTTQFLHMKTGEIISCHKDFSTSRLYCKGLEMNEFQTKMQRCDSLSENYELHGFTFMSYANPNCQRPRDFVDLCLHIGVENMEMIQQEVRSKLHVVVATNKHWKSIEKIFKGNSYLKSKLNLLNAKEMTSGKMKRQNECFLLITDKPSDVYHLTSKHVLLLVIIPSNEQISTEICSSFQKITQQSFLEGRFILMKKNSNEAHKDVPIIVESEDWISSELAVQKQSKLVYVIKRTIESADIPTIIGKSKRDPNIRHLFLVDTKTKSAQDYKSLAQNTLIRQLPVTVHRNGEWGAYRRTTRFADKYLDTPESHNLNIRIEHVDIECVCSGREEHNNHEVHSSQNLSYGIEYSGVHKSGHRIIGLALVESSSSISKVDANFTWTIPEDWSLEEAVTVPFVYTQAHYILSFLSEDLETPTVLFNLDSESLLTACVSLALHRAFRVFVAVSEECNTAEVIKKNFPQINESNILSKEECKYKHQLMTLTKGHGVDLVINGFRGAKHITASLDCTDLFGYFLNIGSNDCNHDIRIGMEPFCRSVTFSVVPNTVSGILKLPEEKKKMLHEQVSEGISHGVVTPLGSKLATHLRPEYEKLMMNKKYVEHVSGNNLNMYDYRLAPIDNSYSYLIIGENNVLLNGFFTWLINEGATKVVVAGEYSESFNIAERMKGQTSAVKMTSHRRADSAQMASKLIHEATIMAPLAAIFFVAVEAPSHKMSNLDIALSSENMSTPIINIFSGGLEQCERRRAKGSPALLIYGDELECSSSVLSHIRKLLARSENHNAPTLYELVPKTPFHGNKSRLKLDSYVVEKLISVKAVDQCTTDTLRFKEITSLSLRHGETRGVQPIFLIPALDESSLEPLIQKLLYPVFSAVLSESDHDLPNTALELFHALEVIQPNGPVTLIGETWNANLTIELSRLVRDSGRNCKLFLLEGDPFEWREWVNSRGGTASSDFDDNLETEIVEAIIEGMTQAHLISVVPSSIQQLANHFVCGSNAKNSMPNYLIKALNVIRRHLIMASHCRADNEVLENMTFFQNHQTVTSQLKLSVSSNIIVLNEENYNSCIRNATVSRVINENASFSWWD